MAGRRVCLSDGGPDKEEWKEGSGQKSMLLACIHVTCIPLPLVT